MPVRFWIERLCLSLWRTRSRKTRERGSTKEGSYAPLVSSLPVLYCSIHKTIHRISIILHPARTQNLIELPSSICPFGANRYSFNISLFSFSATTCYLARATVPVHLPSAPCPLPCPPSCPRLCYTSHARRPPARSSAKPVFVRALARPPCPRPSLSSSSRSPARPLPPLFRSFAWPPVHPIARPFARLPTSYVLAAPSPSAHVPSCTACLRLATFCLRSLPLATPYAS